MCDHFHLMVKPHELANISKVVQFLKRHVSRNANIIMSPCVSDKDVERNIYNDGDVVEGDIGQCRLHENYYNDIDGKVNILRRRFAQKHKTHQPYSPFKWQKSYHDHIIRDEPDFEHHYRYTVYNYLKHNLHKNWEFTSLRYPGMVDQ
jgi:REP element-mobilizing transposase RayT